VARWPRRRRPCHPADQAPGPHAGHRSRHRLRGRGLRRAARHREHRTQTVL